MISASVTMCRYHAYLGPQRGCSGSSENLSEIVALAKENNAWYVVDITTLGPDRYPWKNFLLDLDPVNMEGIA